MFPQTLFPLDLRVLSLKVKVCGGREQDDTDGRDEVDGERDGVPRSIVTVEVGGPDIRRVAERVDERIDDGAFYVRTRHGGRDPREDDDGGRVEG